MSAPRPAAVPETARLTPLVGRVLGLNPGLMTGHGTNTYLVGARRPILLDTGAGVAGYIRLLMSFLGSEGLEDVSRVILTHRHVDHIGGVPDVRRAFPRVPVAKLIKNDASLPVSMESLADGAVIRGDGVTLHAIYTPGHASDHLCFALPGKDGTAVLFSADHVMSWSTSVVSPPGGPTVVTMEVPCALSSPKTSHSSGTA